MSDDKPQRRYFVSYAAYWRGNHGSPDTTEFYNTEIVRDAPIRTTADIWDIQEEIRSRDEGRRPIIDVLYWRLFEGD